MKYFILYASCVPVKGYKRSIICDLQKKSYSYIPNELYEILIHKARYQIERIKKMYDFECSTTIDEYFDFLIKEQYGFFSDRLIPNLENINLSFYSSEKITNAIIDINSESEHPYTIIAEQLNLLRCKFLQLRFFDEVESNYLDEVLNVFRKSTLRSIYIVIPDAEYISNEFITTLIEKHLRVMGIIIYSCPKKQIILDDKNGAMTKVFTVPYSITSSNCCGEVSPSQFSINLSAFSESHHFNSCLHKKISIDVDGNIKNCPSLKITYGNIKENLLIEVVEIAEFNKLWGITKDKVNICRECEFRYICTDCRAFLQNPEDGLSKPLKCGYDPYTAQWSNWETNPVSRSGIEHHQLFK